MPGEKDVTALLTTDLERDGAAGWVSLVMVLGDVSEAWLPESLHLGQLDHER